MYLEDQAVPKFYKKFRYYTKVTSAQFKACKTTPIRISESYNPKYFPIVRHCYVHKFAGSVAYVANGNADLKIGIVIAGPTFVALSALEIATFLTTNESYGSWYGMGAAPYTWTSNTESANNWTSGFYAALSLPTADLVTGDGELEIVALGDLIPKFPRL